MPNVFHPLVCILKQCLKLDHDVMYLKHKFFSCGLKIYFEIYFRPFKSKEIAGEKVKN